MASKAAHFPAKGPAPRRFPAPAPLPTGNNGVFTLDDGTKEITLVNPFGQVICKLHIRTSDISIFNRFNALVQDFQSITQPLKELSLNANGTSSLDEDMAKLKVIEDVIIQKIDALLDTNGEAATIFAQRNPFSSVGGQFFVEKVLEVLGGVIAQGVEEEAKKASKRMAPYLSDIQPENAEVSADAGATPDNA